MFFISFSYFIIVLSSLYSSIIYLNSTYFVSFFYISFSFPCHILSSSTLCFCFSPILHIFSKLRTRFCPLSLLSCHARADVFCFVDFFPDWCYSLFAQWPLNLLDILLAGMVFVIIFCFHIDSFIVHDIFTLTFNSINIVLHRPFDLWTHFFLISFWFDILWYIRRRWFLLIKAIKPNVKTNTSVRN